MRSATPAPGALGSISGFDHPEDLELVDPACTAPPDLERFAAHGLGSRTAADGTVTLAVVGHGAREAIELFELEVPLPPDAMGNDVAIAPDGEIMVTKFIPYREGIALRFQALRASVGFESGEVLAWSPERGWRAVAGTRGAGPNGRLLAAVHLGGARALFQACLLHWAVFEVDPESLAAREILDHEGEVLCGATSVTKVCDRHVIGSMNETRVGVWQPAP